MSKTIATLFTAAMIAGAFAVPTYAAETAKDPAADSSDSSPDTMKKAECAEIQDVTKKAECEKSSSPE